VALAGVARSSLRSAANGLKDDAGWMLDGDGNGIMGDDFVRTLTVVPSLRVLRVPDFARGPGQPEAHDRLRDYPHWLAARNLANEASDESVSALVDAVRGRYELAQRWYRLKARLLGIDRLADYDRSAAVTQEDETFTWSAGRDLVLDSYTSFSTELGSVARRFFEQFFWPQLARPRLFGKPVEQNRRHALEVAVNSIHPESPPFRE
jgi:hypothetical protein